MDVKNRPDSVLNIQFYGPTTNCDVSDNNIISGNAVALSTFSLNFSYEVLSPYACIVVPVHKPKRDICVVFAIIATSLVLSASSER